MEWLNYHHLLYFWTTAREGSVTRAAEQLRLAQPTVSGQLRALEEALGEKLFERRGRRLELTERGRLVYGYADEIFSLGRELVDTLKDRPTGRPLPLVVGVADVLPKLVTYRLLAPALALPEGVKLVCREDKPERLLTELALHQLDVVLSDAPLPPGTPLKAWNHLLGECGVSVFGAPPLQRAHARGFPGSLAGAPFLLPGEGTTLRRSIDQWLDARDLRPRVVGEVQDSALLKVFGQAGLGLFAAPDAVAAEVERQYEVRRLGTLEGVRERFYAISGERRLKHPAVVALQRAARSDLFA
jgi:LysR family transcriptional activator of nhaA